MITIVTAIPDDLAPRHGEEIQFQALVQEDGTLFVTHILHREPAAAKTASTMTLNEWAQKWGGTLQLEPGETVDSIRNAYMKEKFGN